jgi:predicted ArsR family transcriptional regulator
LLSAFIWAICKYRRLWTLFSSSLKEIEMHTTTTIIHQCLKKHGQLLDSEIAAETGIPLAKVRFSLSDLSEQGEISRCSVTRFDDGKPVEGFLCRISGYVPKPAPGRKPATKN